MDMATQDRADVAIIGGGPAGMQAALVLARTSRTAVVFDPPVPSRNWMSHGVHNFLGVDGLLVPEVREVAWRQIDVYKNTDLRREWVEDVGKTKDGFVVRGSDGSGLHVRNIVLAFGYHDVLPDVPGFAECWADTIIPCSFCDGYENRGRVWGSVAQTSQQLDVYPRLDKNWASEVKLIVSPEVEVPCEFREELNGIGVTVHDGPITEVHHDSGKVQAVTVDSGKRVEVGTLHWMPPKRQSPLVEKLVRNIGLELEESGFIKTDELQETNVEGVYAVGDLKGWTGGLRAAEAGDTAASTIVKRWYA